MEHSNSMKNETGAVIVASCASKHTKRFRPVLPVGGQTLIRRLVNAYHAAGVQDVVVVTGAQATEVESELKGSGAEILYDPDYRDREMLESAKLGIERCRGRCERIFVSPVCIPVYSAERIEQMLSCEEAVCIPVSDGLGGHPVLLGEEAVEQLMRYHGPDGIRGAI